MIELIQKNDIEEPGMPRYRALAAVLRSRILSGKLADGTRFPSEAEFAAELGINHRTLRAGLKLLVDEHLISQCRGRGTFVTYSRKMHLKIGVLLGEANGIGNDIYMLRLIAGLSHAIDNNPYGELQFMTSPSPRKVFELIQQRECQALIVLDRERKMACKLCDAMFKTLPIIFVNPSLPNLAKENRYEVDIAPGSTLCGMRYLYALGHRKIGFISAKGTRDQRVTAQNQEFLEACEELGISNAYQRLVSAETPWFDSVRETVRELVSAQDHPTALLCPGFVFSSGAWQGVMDARLQIPEDISFLGFDANTNSNPHMSSLDAPLDQLTAKAVELAFALQNEWKYRKERCWMIPRFHVDRGSCKALN